MVCTPKVFVRRFRVYVVLVCFGGAGMSGRGAGGRGAGRGGVGSLFGTDLSDGINGYFGTAEVGDSYDTIL
jgi:hypothetical protein